MLKLTIVIEVIVLFACVVLAAVSSTLYSKIKQQRQTITELTQQLQQTTQQIDQFKK